MTENEKFAKPAGTETIVETLDDAAKTEAPKVVTEPAKPMTDRLLCNPLHKLPQNIVTKGMALGGGKALVDDSAARFIPFGNGAVQLERDSLAKAIRNFPLSATMLFLMAMESLYDNNNAKAVREGKVAPNSKVRIRVEAYALLRGYLKPEDIPDENDLFSKKRKRYNDIMKNTAREIREIIPILVHTQAMLEQTKEAKKKGATMGVLLLHGIGKIQDREVFLWFNDEITRFMLSTPFGRIHQKLFTLMSRDSNAFSIGFQICSISSMDINIKKGRANIHSTKNLLSQARFKELEKEYQVVTKDGKRQYFHPSIVIKAFCNIMEKLVKCGVIARWNICKAGGTTLTDEEYGRAMTDWAYFQRLYVYAPVADEDQDSALEAANRRYAWNQAKKNHKKLPKSSKPGTKSNNTTKATGESVAKPKANPGTDGKAKSKPKKAAKPKTVYTPIGEDEELY